MAIEIKYNYVKQGIVRVVGIKAMKYGHLPEKYKKESQEFVFGFNSKIVYKQKDKKPKMILTSNGILSKKQFDKRIKIIHRCGEALHQYNKKNLNRIRTIKI